MLHTTGEPSIHYKAQIYTSKLLLCFAPQSLDWNCPIFKVKCRKTFNGAGLGFCNRRVNIFNLWLFFSLSQWLNGFQTEAFRFLVSKVLSCGNFRVKTKQHRWNKCQKLQGWHLAFFVDENVLVQMFSWGPKMKKTIYSKCPGSLWRHLLPLKTISLFLPNRSLCASNHWHNSASCAVWGTDLFEGQLRNRETVE